MERRPKALVGHDQTQIINRNVVRTTLHGKEMLCFNVHTRRCTHTHKAFTLIGYTDREI